MKAEQTFVLEAAGWPAILVDPGGAICRANQAAALAFGPRLQGRAPQFASLWAADNACSAVEFLKSGDSADAGCASARLLAETGTALSFNALISPVTRQGQQYYLLQLFTAAAEPLALLPEPWASRKVSDQSATVDAPAPPREPTPPPEKAPPAMVPEPVSSLDAATAQKQKLECALQLTRTVVLDFNNALTSILGHTSLLLSKAEPGHPWRGSLLEVEKSAEKAAEIAHDLATFSRQEKESKEQNPGNLNDLLRRTVALFRTSSGAALQWDIFLQDQIYSVKYDEAKIQQAFVKVIENAVQALGDKGCVSVRTRNVDLKEARQDGAVQVPPGSYVCVEIADTGPGIAPEVLPRVFEPFFTTKKAGQHRGLGLAFVYGITTNHGGCVTLTSQVGQGAAVRLYLPAQRRFVKDRHLTTADLGGRETILMVDDEELLLTMGQTVLTSFGYKVLVADSAMKALEIFSSGAQTIDLVITDLVMPVVSGRELMERLRQLSPAVRIICSSGYLRNPGQEEDVGFLKKPFTAQDLLRKVKQALE